MSLRERFPIFEHKAFINSCSYAALSVDVRKALEQYLEDRDNYGSHWEHWVGLLEELRLLTASLTNAGANEIALTSSLSEGVNALASSFRYEDRKKIVITDYDFPTTAQIWQAQQIKGAETSMVMEDKTLGKLPLDGFEKAIDDNTFLVSVPYICYRNGARQEVEEIIKLAHERGALVFVDCYQAIGSFPVDVKELNADFIAGGMLKYLLSTAGTGYLYVREGLIEQFTPTTSGWFAQENIHAMDHTINDPAISARRFESGTPNVPNLYAGIAGLKLVEQVGVANIQKEVGILINEIKQRAQDEKYKLGMEQEAYSPMVTLQSTDMYALVARLEEDNVVTSCRDDNLRISPHFYNNSEDIEQLFTSLNKNRNLMR